MAFGNTMSHYDGDRTHPKRARGPDILEVARAQELRSNHPDQSGPAEQQHQPEQPPEAGFDDTGENDKHEQLWETAPDFYETLTYQINPATKKALYRTREDANYRATEGEQQTEYDGESESVEKPGDHVASLVVGAQPVLGCGCGGGRARQIVIYGVVAVTHGWPQHPAPLLDQIDHEWIAVLGFSFENPIKGGLRITDKNRKIDLSLVGQNYRFVVGDEFPQTTQGEERAENPQRVVATPICAKARPAPFSYWTKLNA